MKEIHDLIHDLRKPACEWEYPRVGLYMPIGSTVPGACFRSHVHFQRFHRLPETETGRSLQMDMIRTRACSMFLKRRELTHLLMLDADHMHPARLVAQLARWVILSKDAENPVEVVAGMNYTRTKPYKPCCFADDEENGKTWDGKTDEGLALPLSWGEKGLLKVAIAGTGAILIARTALERLEKPYFYMPYSWIDKSGFTAWPGEDVGFAIRCRDAGVVQYVDPEANSPHLAESFVGHEQFDPVALECEPMMTA